MELLDVIDEKGNVIGTKERAEIYKTGELHRTVHIWIINENKEILVQKRSYKKDTFPGVWAISACGHIKSGETSIKAAFRELKEELGLVPAKENLELLFSLRRREKQNGLKINTLDDIYLLRAEVNVDQTKLQFSELTDIKFVYYEYLEQIYKNGDTEYVPRTEEHDKLFKHLHDIFDEHDSIKVLFKTEFENTYDEYSRINKLCNKHDTVLNSMKIVSVISILSLIGIYIVDNNALILNILLFVIIMGFEFIFLYPRYKAEYSYESDKLFKDTNLEWTFYEDYFSIKTKQVNLKVYYAQIYKVIETEENYYLYTSENMKFGIKKKKVPSSFYNFIRSKITCKYDIYS